MRPLVTIDMNCIIEVEENRSWAADLKRLLAAHDAEKLDLAVPGISAAERLTDGSTADSFEGFQNRVQSLSIRSIEFLRPPFHLGLTYFDWAIFVDEPEFDLEQQIHSILFPQHPFEWIDEATRSGVDPESAATECLPAWHKWLNRKCDTLAMWCHIYYKRDVFVTIDRNFHKLTKKGSLEALGAKSIFYPSYTVI